MATTATEIQALYVAYFNRPADVLGLQFWLDRANQPGKSADTVANEFSNSKEYRDLYANKTSGEIVDAIYMNLFGRHAETAGLVYWALKLDKGELNIGNVARIISTSAQNEDKIAIDSKVDAASQFTASLTDAAEILGYSGDAANAVAKTWLAGVKDADTLAAATTDAALDAVSAAAVAAHDGIVNVPKNFDATAGVDTFVGGLGNDTFASNNTATTTTLTGLDKFDGGAGNDTLQIIDTKTLAGAAYALTSGISVSNIENLTVVTNGSVGAAGTAFDVSGFTGLTAANFVAAGDGTTATNVKVGSTTTAAVTVAAGAATITGGTANSITNSSAAGVSTITGAALTTATVKGGGNVQIDNVDAAAATGAGTTLTSVTLDGNTAGATVKGASLTNVTIKNITAAATDTITNGTAKHTLHLNVEKAGKAGQVVTVADATAETIAVTAAGTVNNVKLSTGAGNTVLKTVTVAGAGTITLDVDGTNNTAVTAIDGSAATGDITLSNILATTVSVKTGAGDDTFTTTQTTKAAFATGAGDDTVTVGSALAAGTTIDLGEGDDAVLFSAGGSVANTSGTNVTVIDGGAGSDTLALALVGSSNVGVFKNFEAFDVIGMGATTLDLDILAANNTVTGISGSGALAGAAVLTNVGAGVGFTALASMGATAVTLTQKTAGALSVTLNADSTDDTAQNDTSVAVTATNATSLKAVFNADSAFVPVGGTTNDQSITLTGTKAASLEIVSGGTNAVNSITYTSATNGASSAADILTSVTASGAQALTFNYTPTIAANIATFDASAMTGSLTIATTGLKNGGTIKLGSGADVVDLALASNAATGAAEALVGFSKAASTTAAADIAAADHLTISSSAAGVAVVGVAATGTGYAVDAKGIVTFTGAGPTTLDAAIALAGTAAGGVAGNAVAFQYIGDTYIFVEGAGAATAVAATDYLVKLTGTTGVTSLNETGTNVLFIA